MSEDIILQKASNNTANLAGFYNIEIKDEGVFLAVYPAQGTGSPVKEASVIRDLRDKDAEDISIELIASTVREAAGIPVRVAAPPLPEQDPEIIVDVTRDKLEARIRVVFPKRSRNLTRQMVEIALKNAKISYGIDQDSINKLIEQPTQVTVVAKGIAPISGDDAKLIYHVDLSRDGHPEELEDGRVDYKNLNLFNTVQQGQVLVEKIPPTNGTPGTDVYGDVLGAKPGKELPLPLGKNVEVVPGTSKIIASIPGQIVQSGNKLHVLPVIEIRGDVDLSTGNIDFIGNVIIRGSVQPGFTVKADGDVEIYGTVSGGIVEGRNILIRMGIQGMNKGYIKASENVTAKFIENAIVYAGADVSASEAVMHSKIYAGKKVVVEGRRGLIVGGVVCAGEEIRGKTMGSPLATPTDVEVGVNPALREEYANVKKELKLSETNLDQTKKALNTLKAMDQATMPEEKRQMLLKMTKANFHLLGQVETLKNRLMEIELAFEEMRAGRIRASEHIYPGVKVTVGTVTKPMRDPIKYASVYCENGEIKIGVFK